MRTMLGVVLAVCIALFCVTLMRGLVFAVELPFHAGQALWYNTQGLLMAPARVLPMFSSSVLLLISILLIAALLRWAFGGRRDERPASRQDYPAPEENNELTSLARDLDRMAQRLDARIEALETILLEPHRSANQNRENYYDD